MHPFPNKWIGVGGILLAACLLAPSASAQTSSEGLSPTLANIKRTQTVRLGYRESSPPFSFLDQANRPIGYSLELCEAVVDEIGVEVDDPNLKIEYVKVTSDDRIPAVLQNKIDLECGSTTANAERARQVAFSPLMFVAGTKLMVPKAAPVQSVTDLKGKTVVVTKGTTNEQAMHTADKKFSLGLNIVTAPDHEQSYQMLSDGKADAFATDDILLYGLIVRHKSQDKFRVTGEFLSYDPYGIMFRKGEPQLAAVVERTFPQTRFESRPDSALQQMVRLAPADRREAQRRDLAAARGGVQGAQRYRGDEQLSGSQDSAGPLRTL